MQHNALHWLLVLNLAQSADHPITDKFFVTIPIQIVVHPVHHLAASGMVNVFIMPIELQTNVRTHLNRAKVCQLIQIVPL